MANTGPADDFFGASYIGASPYANPTAAYLNNLTALHGIVQGQATGMPQAGGGGSQPQPYSSYGFDPYAPGSDQPGVGQQPRNAQTNNPTNTMRSTSSSLGSGNTQPWMDYSNTNIPPDIQGLRQNLISYLGRSSTENPNYSMMPGSDLFNLDKPQANGQLVSSLNAIQSAGQGNIDQRMADIREQYGQQGLGLGTDVSRSLMLGATQGQQQIESQQSSLLTQILQAQSQQEQQGQMFTKNMQYQNFLRQTGLPPNIQAALGYTTSYPPSNQFPSTGASLGSAAIGGGSSIISGLIAAGAFL